MHSPTPPTTLAGVAEHHEKNVKEKKGKCHVSTTTIGSVNQPAITNNHMMV
jgi:hypothetical protein